MTAAENAGEQSSPDGSQDSLPEEAAIRQSRVKLIAIFSIAFVPLFVAYFGYFFLPQLAPQGKTNQGELILPPVDAKSINEELTANGTWQLILPVETSCDETCKELLYLSRQIVTGLGKNSDRVGRVMLTTEVPEELGTFLDQEHGDLRVLDGDRSGLTGVYSSPALFLMDPNGNVMMYFTPDKAGKPMLKDLKHLLKISNIG